MKRFVMLVVVSLCVCLSYASWQNPVFLSELNDRDFLAGGVRISCDETILLFGRDSASKQDALYEAHRNPATGLFDQQRQLSELKNGGAQVYGGWISADNLRLYYATTDPQTLGASRRPIWLAIRDNPNQPWQTIKRFNELEVLACQSGCCLTADEKMIMWETAAYGSTERQVFTATRPSILHGFSNVRRASEFDGLNALCFIMNPDGLSVFFRIWNEYKWDAWMARRKSLDMPFGDFKPVAELNSSDFMSTDPSITWDGKYLYYTHANRLLPSSQWGVYMSQWVDSSFEDALANMNRAINKKERAIELLQQAAQDEQIAGNLLTTLPAEAFPSELTPKAISTAVRRLEQSMAKQDQIAGILGLCLENLKLSIRILLPPLPPQ